MKRLPNGTYHFRCRTCKADVELTLPPDMREPFGCPAQCGTTYVQYRAYKDLHLRCVAVGASRGAATTGGDAMSATPTPTFRFAVGQCVTWREVPGAVWQIIERRQHEGVATIWRTYDLLPAAGDLTDFRPLSAAEADLEAVEEETP
jgi:hypothetical protein